MSWYIKVLTNYVTFSGRARRKEYWMFFLFNCIVGIILMVTDNLLGLNFTYEISGQIVEDNSGWLSAIYELAIFLPCLAVTCRRLHDTSRSGWWILMVFLPCIGAIWLLVLMCFDSTPGENEYGPNPKGL